MNLSFGSESITDHRELPRSANWQFVLLRLGLAGAGALLIQLAIQIATAAPLFSSRANIILVAVSGFSGLCSLVAAGVRRPSQALRWITLVAYVCVVIVRSIIWTQTSGTFTHVTIDQGIYNDLSGELIRRGENPYTWDFAGAFDLYRTAPLASTPRLDGSIKGPYNYPALAFLLSAPLQAVGLPGTFMVLVTAQIAVLLLLYFAAPRAIQPVILFPIFAGFDFVGLSLIGVLDILWAAFLVAMVVVWKKPTLRAILFGLAVSVKQIPWLVVPFLILRIWRDEETDSPASRVGKFAGISALTFIAVNGFFIMSDANAYLRGVTGPLWDNMVILSQGGLSTITHLGLIDLPKSYYLLATFSVLVLLLFWYWRHYDVLRDAFWIFPGILMWFSYRNLTAYWVYWVLPLLAALMTRTPAATPTANSPGWRFTLAASAGVLMVLLSVGAYLSSLPDEIEIRLRGPMVTSQGRVIRMEVEVMNRSQRDLIPRFAIQRFTTIANPQPWRIENGPLTLQPGETGTYRIFTNQEQSSFIVYEAAQLVVTDALGSYSLRGVATIGPDNSFLWPEAIPNPGFVFWDSGQSSPIWWGLSGEVPGTGSVTLEDLKGRETLKLTLEASDEGQNRVALESWIVFPSTPFGIWIYLDPPSDVQGSVAYGLELDDGQHTLRFQYGAHSRSERIADGEYVIHQTVPAHTWVLQEVDFAAAYAQAGWQLPDLKPTTYKGMDTALRMVFLRIYLAADGPRNEPLVAHFGPIEQDYYRVTPQTLMAETLDDPAGYYIRLAESYSQGRNYGHALQANQRALDFPQNGK